MDTIAIVIEGLQEVSGDLLFWLGIAIAAYVTTVRNERRKFDEYIEQRRRNTEQRMRSLHNIYRW